MWKESAQSVKKEEKFNQVFELLGMKESVDFFFCIIILLMLLNHRLRIEIHTYAVGEENKRFIFRSSKRI